jgi:dipeptidase E
MGTIIAIGGGDIKDLDKIAIDKYIVSLAGKKCPKVLFIPTASDDSGGYVEVFNNLYAKNLGCDTDTLLLVNENLSSKEIENKIMLSDIIYVGGGDTSKMLDIWRKHKVHMYLKKAYEKGVILSGLSAGSICWFKYGYSDSNKDGSTGYRCVEALGFINAIHCPHYHEERRNEFDIAMETKKEIGIALENNCAIVFKDDHYRIIKSDETANAYKLFNSNGKVQKCTLKSDAFVSINELYDVYKEL